jgi:hypothetical protein
MLHGREALKIRSIAAAFCACAMLFAGVSGRVIAQQTSTVQKSTQVQAPGSGGGPQGSAVHSISVAFNYDFTKTPACSDTVVKNCVAKFKVFDISVPETPYLLFTIQVPAGAAGKTNLIKATGPRLPFVIGKHRLGVSAVTPEGAKSDPMLCSTVVSVGPST